MDNWDTETRIWIVRRYHALESVVSVQREYRRTFGGNPPSRWTIMRLVNNFAEHGTVNRRPYHRNPSVRTEETIAAVAAAIQNNPRVSTRSLSAQMGGNQRDLARQKAQKKVQELSKGKRIDNLTVEQRKARDAEMMREKQKKKEEAAAAATAGKDK